MICCCGLFHFQRMPESAAWSPPSPDAITPCLMECLLFLMRDQPDCQQINITSADTIRPQHSEVLTGQCSRANGGSGQKNDPFPAQKKKPPDGDSEHFEWYVCFSVHQQWIDENSPVR